MQPEFEPEQELSWLGGWTPDRAVDRSLLTPMDLGDCGPGGETGAVEGWGLDESNGSHRREPSRSQIEPAPTSFPRPGDIVAGFRIVSELGRGSFGRVYLAEQGHLSERQVALKVARALGAEPLWLARLQHTHIVPVYSVHDDPQSGLRILCMPYLGGANLAQILDRSGARVPTRASGHSLVEAIDRPTASAHSVLAPADREHTFDTNSSPSPTRRDARATHVRSALARHLQRVTRAHSGNGAGATKSSQAQFSSEESIRSARAHPSHLALASQPARDYLEHHSYVQSCVWIVARLAEALEHAHARGILHRDLKPSNVLLTADGTPMLVDFNLAVDAHRSLDEPGSEVGGTLLYMAPEHLDAFNSTGKTAASAVDQRSDLYSLGLILYEMLAGTLPFAGEYDCDRSPKFIEELIADRWRGAPGVRRFNSQVPPSLESLIAKCLEPDPARRYQSASNLAEDLRRFLDDRALRFAPDCSPRERLAKWARRHPRASSAGSVAAVAAIALTLSAIAVGWLSRAVAVADARAEHQAFLSDLHHCQVLLNTADALRDNRSRGFARALAAFRRYGLTKGTPEDALRNPRIAALPEPERNTLREQLSELALHWARARALDAQAAPVEVRRRALEQAVAWLDRAEAIDPHPPAALYLERSAYLNELGRDSESSRDAEAAARMRPSSARDYDLLGSALAARGQIDQAVIRLEQAISLDPTRFWAWFVLGICHLDLEQTEAAIGDFGACSLLEPGFAWPVFNRGLALARAGRPAEAQFAYDRALRLDPSLLEARINRGLLHLERGAFAEALADLDAAIGRAEPRAEWLAARAEALDRLGRPDEAETQFESAIRAKPDDPSLLVARGFARLRLQPERAFADFQHALTLDPHFARAHLGIGLYWRATRPDLALRALDHAVESDPRLAEAFQLRAIERAKARDPKCLDDVGWLEQHPSALNLYNAACALTLSADESNHRQLERAAACLTRAVARGFPRSVASDDPDLRRLERYLQSTGTSAVQFTN
jgi:serine/threonine protein kinase/Tfp pilus assembly protein PilF